MVDSADNCIVCIEGRANPPECDELPLAAGSARVDHAPFGSAIAIKCSDKCKTCEKSPDNCIVCAEGRTNPPTCQCAPGYTESYGTCTICPV